MAGIFQFHKKLGSLIDSYDSMVANIIDENGKQYAQANANEQMYERGKRADGSDLPDYSPVTIQIKKAKGQRTDHMTLRDTKAFHKRMYAELQGETLKISSHDSKAQMLKGKYGDIFGLMDEIRRSVSIKYVKPIFINKIRAKLKLKLK